MKEWVENVKENENEQELVDNENPFETTAALHRLVWRITWLSHAGALEKEGIRQGVLEVCFSLSTFRSIV